MRKGAEMTDDIEIASRLVRVRQAPLTCASNKPGTPVVTAAAAPASSSITHVAQAAVPSSGEGVGATLAKWWPLWVLLALVLLGGLALVLLAAHRHAEQHQQQQLEATLPPPLAPVTGPAPTGATQVAETVPPGGAEEFPPATTPTPPVETAAPTMTPELATGVVEKEGYVQSTLEAAAEPMQAPRELETELVTLEENGLVDSVQLPLWQVRALPSTQWQFQLLYDGRPAAEGVLAAPSVPAMRVPRASRASSGALMAESLRLRGPPVLARAWLPAPLSVALGHTLQMRLVARPGDIAHARACSTDGSPHRLAYRFAVRSDR